MEIIKSDKAKNHEINGYNLKILEISKHNGQNSKSDFFPAAKRRGQVEPTFLQL